MITPTQLSPAAPCTATARRAVLLSAMLVALSMLMPAHAAATVEPVVVYLVRHAERAEDGTRDPPISADGEARARALAVLLADAGVDRIHSTDYRRTRQTGAPMSTATGLPVQSYDPSDLTRFAEVLRSTPGRHLVLGHSDTTPALVRALGGDGGAPIEHMEYDRLYVLVLPAQGPVSTVMLRFGAASDLSH